MKMWMQWTVLGTAVALIGVLAAFRLAHRPAAPPAPSAGSDDDLSVNRAILARSEKKRGLAHAVIAGRLSLLEAAAAFRDLNSQGPLPSTDIRDAFSGASSEDEAYCRSVICYVHIEALAAGVDDPADRLQGELDARLRDGTLRLPGP